MKSGWIHEVPIGEYVDIVSTWNPKRDAKSATFRYVDISSIDQSAKQIVLNGEIPVNDAPSRARQLVRTGDVLVSTVRPNLNSVAYVSSEFDGATASTGFCVLRPKSKKLCGRYLFHWVKTPEFVADMVRKATGQSYPAISDRIVKESLVPLPPLGTQRRIASILDQADALLQGRSKSISALKRLELAAFYKTMENATDILKASTFGALAEKTRNSFCNGPFGSNLLTSELQESGVPVIYIRDIRDGFYRRVSNSCVSERKAAELSACAVSDGDLLIAKVGDPPGISAVYPFGEPNAVVTQDVIRLRPDLRKADTLFLSVFLNSTIGRKAVEKIIVQATRARFSLQDLKALELSIPDVRVQRDFAQKARLIRNEHTSSEGALASSGEPFLLPPAPCLPRGIIGNAGRNHRRLARNMAGDLGPDGQAS